MASIVTANANLTAGGLAVLRRSFSTTQDGTLTYEADYACLSRFARNHVGVFRTGANPPTALPAALLELRLVAIPKLFDLTTETINGLTYFKARYSTASKDEVTITESSEQRSFSGVAKASVRVAGNLGSTATVEGVVPVSFDYISVTVSATAKNAALPNVKGRISSTFNFSVGSLSGVKPMVLGGYYATTIETRSKTRSSNGEYSYTLNSSGIYQSSSIN